VGLVPKGVGMGARDGVRTLRQLSDAFYRNALGSSVPV
jgi:hypothetical protein